MEARTLGIILALVAVVLAVCFRQKHQKSANTAKSYDTKMATNKAPGSSLLLATGIIYAILGGINVILSFVLLNMADAVQGTMLGVGNAVAAGARGIAILGLIAGAWSLVVGVMGINHRANLDKAHTLRAFAIIALSLSIIIIFIVEFSFLTFLSLVTPILYLVGAQKNVKALAEVGVGNPGENNSISSTTNPTDPLVKRAFMLLEDGEWDKADELLEQALNANPENAQAYIGKLCAELRLNCEEDLLSYGPPIAENSNYKRALRFADGRYKKALELYALTPDEQAEAAAKLIQELIDK